MGRQDSTGYPESGTLAVELGVTYYWRIDEIGDSNVWTGDVWQFTISDGNMSNPRPANLAVAVDPCFVELEWDSGCTAHSHDVYFGTDRDAVRDATTADANLFMGNQPLADTNYSPPAVLDFLTYYYWRIDEVEIDGSTRYKGRVWQFKTRSEVGDLRRILWYKFDETGGTLVRDSSGYEHHGSGEEIGGQWEPNNGHIDGCLDFDADEHVDAPMDTLDTIDKEITVTVWVKGDDDHADEEGKIFDTGDGSYHMRARIPDDNGDLLWRAGNDSNDELVWRQATPLTWAEEWHFFAFVKDENADTMKIYFDGLLADSKDGVMSNTLAQVAGTTFRIGADNDQSSDYTGKLDDFRVYDVALPDIEISGLFRGEDIALAWGPSPFDGQADVLPDVNMSWRRGAFAEKHDVYLGTDWDDVNDANTASAPIYRGRLNPGDPCEYDPPINLEMGQTYYWRIDEVNTVDPNLWKGKVWQFGVANYFIVDDFESYDDYGANNNPIDGTWGDLGFGYTALGAEPDQPVNGGSQSMWYQYDNETLFLVYWSATEMSFGGATDLTYGGQIKALTLYFYGDPDNDANDTEELYVALEGSYAEVRYSDDHGYDNNDLRLAEWTEWNIPLSDFNGVDPCAATGMQIGFGDSTNNTTQGGTGTVFIDDIRLYPSRCMPEFRKPQADLNNDCEVSWPDVEIVAAEWLLGDVNVNPVTNPGDANLVGHWELEGDADDSSTSAYHGTPNDCNCDWIAGKIGSGAIDLYGGWVVVEDDGNTPLLRPANQVSVAAWINLASSQPDDTRLVIKGRNNYESYGMEIQNDGFGFFIRDPNREDVPDGGLDSVSELPEEEWVHVAGTYDNDEMTVYVNGQVDANETVGAKVLFADANDGLGIGGRYGDTDNRFDGAFDDVRIYNRGLTRAEVAWLASESTGTIAFGSEANLFDGESPEIINIRDAAVLLNDWLKVALWPE
jgi:hypothetical protein